ncbi:MULTISPECIES: DUF1835 domain-containing protein [Bacillus cereus group]|uniref:DUF1835 domain-containing protein n=1 Tax=Bacillus cereus group TaxID=86661 RepID=UPI001F56CDF7|nr:DUF1835 domain-containing protein [Bacillus cereus group sp. BfR-BA-01522]
MRDQLRKNIDNMSEEEVKSLLRLVLLQLELVAEHRDEEMIHMVAEISKQLIESQKPTLHIKDSEHVHIAFGDSSAGCLKHTLKKEGFHQDYVISLSDIFSVGPIFHLDDRKGQVARQEWLSSNLSTGDFYFEEEYLPRFLSSLEEMRSISKDTSVTIWKADNAHEHVGLCFALAMLKDKKNIRIINASEAQKELLNKEYDICGTGELAPEDIAVILEQYKEKECLKEEARADLTKEWNALSTNTALLRIWKDGIVHSVVEDYFDEYIVRCAKEIGADKGFSKAAHVIGEVLGRVKQLVGDVFLEYRLQTLIKQNIFQAKGSLKAMRYYSVKLNR